MQHAVVTVRTASVSPNQHRVRVSKVRFETAQSAVGSRVILRAPRDDVHAGYFGSALLSIVELGDRGFLHLSIEDICFLPMIVPISANGIALEEDLAGQDGEAKFYKYAPGLHLVSETTYNSIMLMGGLGWHRLLGENANEFSEDD